YRRILSSKFALIQYKLRIQFEIARRYLSICGQPMIHIAAEKIISLGEGMAVQSQASIRQDFTACVVRLSQSGIISQWLMELYTKKLKIPRERMKNQTETVTTAADINCSENGVKPFSLYHM